MKRLASPVPVVTQPLLERNTSRAESSRISLQTGLFPSPAHTVKVRKGGKREREKKKENSQPPLRYSERSVLADWHGEGGGALVIFNTFLSAGWVEELEKEVREKEVIYVNTSSQPCKGRIVLSELQI